jgi:hypothetical protein
LAARLGIVGLRDGELAGDLLDHGKVSGSAIGGVVRAEHATVAGDDPAARGSEPLGLGPVAWARVWPGVTVFVELPKVTVFRDWFGDQCPECQRVHFPWCGDEAAEQRAAADDGS